jgi:tRNA threonylcarbamoyladenosine biosynthesis protein TsaB
VRILAVDTAANLCSACVFDTQAGEIGRAVLDLGKGHAEQLLDVIAAALKAAAVSYDDIDVLAVSVGPGSFTGVRVGVAAVRGLALALGKPAVSVTTLEALAEEARGERPGHTHLVRIEAGRGQVYLAKYGPEGEVLAPPAIFSIEDADLLIADDGTSSLVTGRPTADIAAFARVAVRILSSNDGAVLQKPTPLYLRDADAKPQGSFALPRRATP